MICTLQLDYKASKCDTHAPAIFSSILSNTSSGGRMVKRAWKLFETYVCVYAFVCVHLYECLCVCVRVWENGVYMYVYMCLYVF